MVCVEWLLGSTRDDGKHRIPQAYFVVLSLTTSDSSHLFVPSLHKMLLQVCSSWHFLKLMLTLLTATAIHATLQQDQVKFESAMTSLFTESPLASLLPFSNSKTSSYQDLITDDWVCFGLFLKTTPVRFLIWPDQPSTRLLLLK